MGLSVLGSLYLGWEVGGQSGNGGGRAASACNANTFLVNSSRPSHDLGESRVFLSYMHYPSDQEGNWELEAYLDTMQCSHGTMHQQMSFEKTGWVFSENVLTDSWHHWFMYYDMI